MAWGVSEFGTSYWGGGPAVAEAPFVTPTTTVEAIRDQMIATIEGLSPLVFGGQKFLANRAVMRFEDWADTHPNACFRRFAVTDLGGYEPPEISDHIIEALRASIRVLVAYPAKATAKWGADAERDMRDVMRLDMHQIDTAIGHRGGANYVAGQHSAIATDKSFLDLDGAVFLDMTYDCYFYRSMT